MSPLRIAIFFLLSLLVLAGCKPQASMTPGKFQELVAAPGDNVPLISVITNGSPYWSNSVATVVMKFASGKNFSEELPIVSKTIGGKYIVYSTHSQLYNGEMNSILTYDEKSRALKVYALYNDLLVDTTIVCDTNTKTYSENSAYGDGFKEITTGAYSDTEDDSHTVIFHNGKWFMTREATNRPVSVLPQKGF